MHSPQGPSVTFCSKLQQARLLFLVSHTQTFRFGVPEKRSRSKENKRILARTPNSSRRLKLNFSLNGHRPCRDTEDTFSCWPEAFRTQSSSSMNLVWSGVCTEGILSRGLNLKFACLLSVVFFAVDFERVQRTLAFVFFFYERMNGKKSSSYRRRRRGHCVRTLAAELVDR